MRLAWRLFACSMVFVTGCSVSTIGKAPVTAPDPIPSASNTAIQGTIRGGQKPLAFAKLYLLAVGTSGYGGNSTSILTAGDGSDSLGFYVLTHSDGTFSIPLADYNTNCAGKVAYLYSSGGDPINTTPTPSNSAATLMALLGNCSTWSLPSTLQLGEVSTVAAAYALAGYATSGTAISRPNNAAAAAAVTNAVLTANNLVDLGSGNARSATQSIYGSNGTVPQQEIHALASSLAACINQSSSANSDCVNLFGYVMSNGASGTTASDTATEAIYIAHNPAVNVTNVFNLGKPQCCFLPTLGSAPNDWTIAVSYAINSLSGAQDVAIDGSGNVWVTNHDQNGSGYSCISELSPVGQDLSSSSGCTGQNGNFQQEGIAIDGTGNIWVANSGANSISEFTSAGAVVATYQDNTNLNTPFGIAVDAANNVWVTNQQANTISELSKTSHTITTNLSGGLSGPSDLAFAPGSNGDIWVANAGGLSGTTVTRFHFSSGSYSPTSYSGNGVSSPINLAIDGSGNAWVANYGSTDGSTSAVSEFDSTGNPVGSSPFTGGGIRGTYGGSYSIAIDGAGTAWIANYGNNAESSTTPSSISAIKSDGTALSGTNGFQSGLHQPYSIAVDASGNVWVVLNGDGKVMELVGAGAPVVTPISTALQNNQLGTRP